MGDETRTKRFRISATARYVVVDGRTGASYVWGRVARGDSWDRGGQTEGLEDLMTGTKRWNPVERAELQ